MEGSVLSELLKDVCSLIGGVQWFHLGGCTKGRQQRFSVVRSNAVTNASIESRYYFLVFPLLMQRFGILLKK